jgi:hypothetical protein
MVIFHTFLYVYQREIIGQLGYGMVHYGFSPKWVCLKIEDPQTPIFSQHCNVETYFYGAFFRASTFSDTTFL